MIFRLLGFAKCSLGQRSTLSVALQGRPAPPGPAGVSVKTRVPTVSWLAFEEPFNGIGWVATDLPPKLYSTVEMTSVALVELHSSKYS